MKQRKLNTFVANISKITSPTSDSFLLIMSHYMKHMFQLNCARFNDVPYNTCIITTRSHHCHILFTPLSYMILKHMCIISVFDYLVFVPYPSGLIALDMMTITAGTPLKKKKKKDSKCTLLL